MHQNQDDRIAWITITADAQQPPSARHQAFGKLVTEFQDMAFGSAYALLRDRASAEDAAQDAFIAAWQNLSQIRSARRVRFLDGCGRSLPLSAIAACAENKC